MNKTNVFDIEAHEELKEKLLHLDSILEATVLKLESESSYRSAVSELFRSFHNIKALSAYVNSKALFNASKTIEDVLSILRQKKGPARAEIVEWLLQISESMSEWAEQVEKDDYDFTPIDAYTLGMVRSAAVTTKKGSEILKELGVLYYDESSSRCAEVSKILSDKTAKLVTVSSHHDVAKHLTSNKINIVVLFHKLKEVDVCKFAKKAIDSHNIQILVVSQTKISNEEKELFTKAGVKHFLSDFLAEDILPQRLINMAKGLFDEKSLKIANSPILKKVSELKPLSSTTAEIRKLSTNPNSSLKEVSDVVTKDPFIAAKLLKIANSPFSGLKGDISSIQHAVSLLGKERVIAISFQSEMERFTKLDFSPYMMDESDFYSISCMRMNLATYWYPKVSVARTGLVSTAALLGNLGQVIIADELKKRNTAADFREILSSTGTPMFAEMEQFGTTAEDTTADILTQWGMDDNMVNILRYSNDISNANDELKKEAIALYAIFNTIPSIPLGIDKDKVDEMTDFLKEMNFDPTHYLKAVERVMMETKR